MINYLLKMADFIINKVLTCFVIYFLKINNFFNYCITETSSCGVLKAIITLLCVISFHIVSSLNLDIK